MAFLYLAPILNYTYTLEFLTYIIQIMRASMCASLGNCTDGYTQYSASFKTVTYLIIYNTNTSILTLWASRQLTLHIKLICTNNIQLLDDVLVAYKL